MKWYPTPSYLLKRRVILEYLQRCNFRNILEVGCGCGNLLHVLERHGYSGMGIDISEEALAVAAEGLSGTNITLACCSSEELQVQFDVVIASEVLEHHQNDVVFIENLRNRVRDSGLLLLTVPAHMKDWGPNDDFCGHIRRYERAELQDKLSAAGFGEIEIFSYGVPLYNIMKPLYDRAIQSATPQVEQREKTTDSGGMWLMRWGGRMFRCLFNDVTMMPFYLLQTFFYGTDLGKGYFVAARKKDPIR